MQSTTRDKIPLPLDVVDGGTELEQMPPLTAGGPDLSLAAEDSWQNRLAAFSNDFPLDDLDDAAMADLMPELPMLSSVSGVSPELATCWGSLITGNSNQCIPGFVPGKGHFKNHFCSSCRSFGLALPTQRVRAIERGQHESFENCGGRGLWSESAAAGIEHRYRLVNQTQKCTGPRLLIMQNASAPSDIAFAQMPARWLSQDAQTIRLIISKGTLTPADSATASTRMAASMAEAAGVIGSGGGFPELSPLVATGPQQHCLPNKRSRSSPASESGSAAGSAVGSAGVSSSAAADGSLTLASAEGTSAASRAGSETGGYSGKQPHVTAEALAAVHDQLARLVVQSFGQPLEEQEAVGIDDSQRTAFVSLLAPLKVSASLLRRSAAAIEAAAAEERASEQEAAAAGPASTPDLEEVSRLHEKTFGAFETLRSEHVLSVASRGIGDAEIPTLIYVLRGDGDGVRSLKSLDLSLNYLTRGCAPLLAAVLEEARLLEKLDLSGTPWGDVGIVRLTKALRRSGVAQLRCLCFRRATIGEQGAAAIAKLLAERSESDRGIEELALESNQIGDAGTSALVGTLLLPALPVSLRLLSFGNAFGGNAIGDAGAIALAQAFSASRLLVLEKLGLSYNLISDDGASALSAALGKEGSAPKLTLLTVSANRISADAVRELAGVAMASKFCLLSQPQLSTEKYA